MFKKFPLEMGARKVRVCMHEGSGRIKRTCAYDWGGGPNFSYFGTYLNEPVRT